MLRVPLLIALCVFASGCQHVLRVGLNPNAEALGEACTAAFPTGRELANWSEAGKRCAPIFQRQSCRDAWASLPERPSPEQFSALGSICAREYCPLSKRHAVVACDRPSEPLVGRSLHDVFSFALSRELGFLHLKALHTVLPRLSEQPPPTTTTPSNGGLDKEVILTVIKTTSGAVKACYESEMRAHEDIDSFLIALSVSARIEPTGEVLKAEISTATERFDAMEACIEQAHRALKYPPPVGGGVVNYTFPYILVPALK